jgi:hypothetical protein
VTEFREKGKMTSIRGILLCGAALALPLNLLHAQTAVVGNFNNDLSLVQAAAPDSIVQILADANGLELLPPGQAPRSGTFWWIMANGNAVPAPCPPLDLTAPIYQLSGSQFLVDQTGGAIPASPRRFGMQAQATGGTAVSGLETEAGTILNLIDRVQSASASQQMEMMAGGRMSMNVSGGPVPGFEGGGGGGSGTNGFYSDSFNFHPDYGTNLWLAETNLAAGYMSGVVSNTTADIQYELQYKTDLSQGDWQSAGWFTFGSETTNWTAWSVPVVSSSNLFLRVRSWQDDGSGLPLWWQQQYFGSTGVDPYGNPAGDGWNNLQKFQNGMNPNVFYTPPAPQGLAVSQNHPNNTATIVWQPSPGSVTGYTVEKTDSSYYSPTVEDFNVSAANTSFVNDISGDIPDHGNGDTYGVSYRVQAQYAGGNSAWSAPQSLQQVTVSGSIIPGAAGTTSLVISGLPANATAVRLIYTPFFWGEPLTNEIRDIPVSDFSNGSYPLPASLQSLGQDEFGNITPDFIQSVDADGNASAATWLYNNIFGQPFVDGRQQIKDNARFLLRAATETPFTFTLVADQNFKVVNTWPTNYVYSGTSGGSDPYLPFFENYRYRNFVFDPNNLDADGNLTTGCYDGDIFEDYDSTHDVMIYISSLYITNSPQYDFYLDGYTTATNSGMLPSLLTSDQSQWIRPQLYADFYGWSAPGGNNVYGLAYSSVESAANTGGQLVLATHNPADNNFPTNAFRYYGAVQPSFGTANYYFVNPATGPLPEQSGFSMTNTTGLMMVGAGQETQIAGYAKLAVLNGFNGVFAYLGQYFDQAYQVDANGNATTNTTGILSPYGSFFATEPGPAALVTMPDIDTGQRGTGTVYCVSLNVDKNHDGNMDLSFNGADATSQSSPMELWVNSGNDQPGNNGSLDKDVPVPPNPPNYAAGKITCQRDLENFFRLWISGTPSLSFYQGYTFTLSISPLSGNPAINVYPSCETNGGTGYLTDTNVAAMQVASAYYANELCTISNSQSYTLSVDGYGQLLFTHFLVEGAGIGSGQLTLTISQNGNAIAQTSVWLDLHDIKDFYERAVIADNMNGAINNWSSSIETVQHPTATISDEDSNIIVLVHGINVGNWDWLDESDTVFKRLYWAGYQGKFATVDWPCKFFNWSLLSTRTSVFNDSEVNAYKAGSSLKNYLNGLRTRFPGNSLNLLVHSQGNAVAGEAIQQGAPFDTYILTQGAMPDSAYDVSAPTDSTLLGWESAPGYHTPEWQPMGYRGIYTNFTGRIVNFYNPNDPVLAWWITDQGAGKPNGYTEHLLELIPPLLPVSSYYTYDGANGWYDTALGFGSYQVTDPQESRAMLSRSRTDAIGQSGPDSAHGVIKSAVDLNANFGFNKAFPADHSAQWTWPIQTTRPYFQQVLTSCQIIPAP